LCLTLEELEEIETTWRGLDDQGKAPILMVGFNRRFAPQVQKMKALLDGVSEPKSFIMTVNAGEIPPEHWTQDPEVGGGRIIGEACHFIDLLRYLADSPVSDYRATFMGSGHGVKITSDKVSITLAFEDGSFGTIHYLANGHKSFPKERLEVFCAGRILQLDNYRKLTGYGWPGFRKMNLRRQDKGQQACAQRFIGSLSSSRSVVIPMIEIYEVSGLSIKLSQ